MASKQSASSWCLTEKGSKQVERFVRQVNHNGTWEMRWHVTGVCTVVLDN